MLWNFKVGIRYHSCQWWLLEIRFVTTFAFFFFFLFWVFIIVIFFFLLAIVFFIFPFIFAGLIKSLGFLRSSLRLLQDWFLNWWMLLQNAQFPREVNLLLSQKLTVLALIMRNVFCWLVWLTIRRVSFWNGDTCIIIGGNLVFRIVYIEMILKMSLILQASNWTIIFNFTFLVKIFLNIRVFFGAIPLLMVDFSKALQKFVSRYKVTQAEQIHLLTKVFIDLGNLTSKVVVVEVFLNFSADLRSFSIKNWVIKYLLWFAMIESPDIGIQISEEIDVGMIWGISELNWILGWFYVLMRHRRILV